MSRFSPRKSRREKRFFSIYLIFIRNFDPNDRLIRIIQSLFKFISKK